MARGAVLALKITGDSRDGVRALNDTESSAGRTGKALGLLAGGAAAALTGVAVLGKAAFDSAAALEQSTGGVAAVFGDMAGSIEDAAGRADKAFGLSRNSYQELATVLGSQLKNAGIDDFAGKTQELIGKGADMAAVFGGSTADAVAALSSALKGEMDPIERYGVSLNQSAIDAKLAALGLDGLEGSAAQAAKAQAILALVNDQSAQTMGAAAAESDTAASKMGQLSAMWENAKATLGEALLPVFVQFADFLQNNVAPIFDQVTAAGGPLSVFLATAGATVTDKVIPALSSLWDELGPKLLPLFAEAGAMLTDVLLPAFDAVWTFIGDYAVPILSAVLGPALDGITSAFRSVRDAINDNKDKFQEFYDKIKPVLDFLRDTVAPFLGGVLKGAFETIGEVIGTAIDALSTFLNLAADVGGAVGKVGGFLNPFDAANPAAGGVPAAGPMGAARLFGAAPGADRLFAASSPSGGAGPSTGRGPVRLGGDVFHINVNVHDTDQAVRKIEKAIERRGVRTGSTPTVLERRAPRFASA